MKTRSRGAAVVALVAASLLSLAAPATAAPAILGVSNGTLLAKGAAVSVSITFQCDEGFNYTLDLTLTQRVNKNAITTGNPQTGGECTGSPQTVELIVRPNVRDTPSAFKAGSALASVLLFDVGENQSLLQEIKLKN
jgi:hypothetical protein